MPEDQFQGSASWKRNDPDTPASLNPDYVARHLFSVL